MRERTALEKSLEANLRWFERSGVMSPADGTWGVGERIVLTAGNTALEKTLRSFPAFTRHGGHVVMEQRRPDCNFEAALMFLLAAKALDKPAWRDTARNLLCYLHCRSGMRNPDLTGDGQISCRRLEMGPSPVGVSASGSTTTPGTAPSPCSSPSSTRSSTRSST